MKTSKALIVIGGVVVTIVLLIIIAVLWLVISFLNINDSKPPWRGPSVDKPVFLYPRNLSTTELSRNSTKFFVVLDSYKIFARPYFATNETLTELEITDSPEFPSNFTKEVYNKGFASDCPNKRIYILKKINSTQSSKQVLDVIQFDDSKKFQRIKRVPNMFDRAVSIASDWTTGNIYWIDNEYDKLSIKVTNKSFGKPEYVVQPTLDLGFFVGDIQVYPKNKEIFFIQDSVIWYTSTSRNSTPKQLFSGRNFWMRNLVINYELDQLCFLLCDDYLKCVDIANSARPINATFFTDEEVFFRGDNFAVADNAFYWIKNNTLLSKNVNGTTNEIASTSGYTNFILSFFSSNCSFAGEPIVNETYETTTILPSTETEAAPKISLPLKSTGKRIL